ncbi:MAG: VanZ family protein [Coriobacteriales bacterium]|jgi:glycopeptide antibiotics resistance protein|nr:VanZ family protein [Coriobacteriales bacterium]
MDKPQRKQYKAPRIVLWTAFILYVLLLIFLLFIPIGFGRQLPFGLEHSQLSWSNYTDHIADYFLARSNFIPFDSITSYLAVITNSGYYFGIQSALTNLFGNLVVFAPMGVFLPWLFETQRRFGKFIITILSMLVAVELIQVLTMVGSLDVDDIILNAAGAVLMWLLLKVSSINRTIRKSK